MEGVRDAIDSLSESENAALGSLSGVLSRLRTLTEFDGLLRDTIGRARIGGSTVARSRLCAETLPPIALSSIRSASTRSEQRLEAVHNAARKFRARPEALPEVLASLRCG